MLKKIKKGKKSVNAKKVTYDGITFDSTLEGNFYLMAKERRLDVEVKPETVTLLESFRFGKTINGSPHTVDGISYTYDFRIGNHYIDTKGRLMKDASMRIRLFKWYLVNNRPNSFFWMPKNTEQIAKVLDIITGKTKKK